MPPFLRLAGLAAAPVILSLALAGCGDDPEDTGSQLTAHCELDPDDPRLGGYVPTDPTAGAGGTVTAGALEAAAVEERIDLPVGSTLGAYGDRALALNSSGAVDDRSMELAGLPEKNQAEGGSNNTSFAPSVGVETFPMAKVVALRAGGENVVLVKLDLGVGFESLTWDVSEALGSDYHGKVLVANSHSHGAYGHYTNDFAMQVAFGPYRHFTYDRLKNQVIDLAQRALGELQPARIGFAHDGDFDPTDVVNRDRRSENDELAGGPRDDDDLYVIRVDAEPGGDPIAMIPIIGLHGTILGGSNLLATTDAPGAIARALQETDGFDQDVVVMHLQGAAGDVSPAGTGGIDCEGHSRCYKFARAETVGRYARDMILPVYMEAATDMTTDVELEMLTRSVALGPDPENFTVRDGALEYAAWDGETPPDHQVYDSNGDILSPIDEFNAPSGAALCADGNVPLPLNPLPSMEPEPLPQPYGTCLGVDDFATDILGNIFEFQPQPAPLCYSTRTTISALRIGDHLVAGAPGEVVTLWADALRDASPVAPDKTIVVGYANDNVGYLLTPEDWLSGGYEPSINLWGPLEGQLVLERTAELLAMAATDEREDGTRSDDTRMTAPPEGIDEPLPPADAAPMAGEVPESLPEDLFLRTTQHGVVPTSAQPSEATGTVQRLDSTYFVWIGEDPMAGTPRVTLQREVGTDTWEEVTRQSGRPVGDRDMILTWTPDPLVREGTNPRTHYWAVEWQAVTPYGVAPEGETTPTLGDVSERVGMPEGTYRFHVEGTEYSVDSAAFDVVPNEALQVSATADGDDLVVTTHYHAELGYRLLTMRGNSNQPVPVPEGASLTVTLDSGVEETATADANGEVRITGAATTTDTVTVTDAYGNKGSATAAM
ncbi:MAG: neutral/alkaline non-lysosomal ceramidase N-terminal domain-containing protein [Myxococcota bacterium]